MTGKAFSLPGLALLTLMGMTAAGVLARSMADRGWHWTWPAPPLAFAAVALVLWTMFLHGFIAPGPSSLDDKMVIVPPWPSQC